MDTMISTSSGRSQVSTDQAFMGFSHHNLPFIIFNIDKLTYPLDSRIKGFLIEVRKPKPPPTPTTTIAFSSAGADIDNDLTPSILGKWIDFCYNIATTYLCVIDAML